MDDKKINIVKDISRDQFKITEVHVIEFKKGFNRFLYNISFGEINWRIVEIHSEEKKRNTIQKNTSKVTRQMIKQRKKGCHKVAQITGNIPENNEVDYRTEENILLTS